MSSQNLVALADIDSNLLAKGAARFPAAKKYADFRVMLEKEADKLDGVVVSTPDHTHAPAAAMALRMKKPVYCEKPLTHTVLEARTLTELARDNKLPTQMGNQIHARRLNYRRVVELVQSGVIGNVNECHVWGERGLYRSQIQADRETGKCELGSLAGAGKRARLLRRHPPV